jgi:DNA-binding NarL/FixJ family response regulator
MAVQRGGHRTPAIQKVKRLKPVQDEHGRDGDSGDPCAALTARELEILKLLAEGKTNKQVAEPLDVHFRTRACDAVEYLTVMKY